MKYYPLRPIQRWLIDTHFNKAKSTMMNIGALFKLSRQIDMKRFAKAINDVLHSYDIFRCRFVFHPETSDLCQTFDGAINNVEVEYMSDTEFKTQIEKLREPYHLIGKPLWRIYVIETPSAKYFYADFYHAIMDGVSTAILFFRTVDAEYRGHKSKRQPPSYASFVEAELKIPPKSLDAGHDYWKKMLATFDERKHLPPVDVKGVAAWTQGNFEYEFKNITEKFFRYNHISENIFFMGATMLTLAKITGSKESVMSWIHNGRTNMNERRLMGLMLEQFPCKWDFHEDISVGEFLNNLFVQTQVGMTYRKSLDAVYNEGLEDNCASFIFQKAMHEDLILDDTIAEVVYMPPNEISAVENALDIEINSEDTGLYTLFLDYDASRYSETIMKNFSEMLDDILFSMHDMNKKISLILS